MTTKVDVSIGAQLLGYTIVQLGCSKALGRSSAAGRVSLQSFRIQRAENVVKWLQRVGVVAHLQRVVDADGFYVVFS